MTSAAVSRPPDEIPIAGDPLVAAARDDEIDALYADVHALATASAGGDPTADARYQERLARLRELQDAEAREMAAFAERRRNVPRGAAVAALDHVDALLETHERRVETSRNGRQKRGA